MFTEQRTKSKYKQNSQYGVQVACVKLCIEKYINRSNNVSITGHVNRTAVAFIVVCHQRSYSCTAFVIRSRTDQSHRRNGQDIGFGTERRLPFHQSYCSLVDGGINRVFTVININIIMTLKYNNIILYRL